MNLFKSLLGRKEPLRISDPVFGDLTREHDLWIQTLKQSGPGYMVIVDAPESGPSLTQQAFFKEVASTLPHMERDAIEFARLHAGEETDMSALSIYALEIGPDSEVDARKFVMELAGPDQVLIHRVSFEAGKPTHITHDD